MKKTRQEVDYIKYVNSICSKAFTKVEEILKDSIIVDGFIIYKGNRLTSEFLKLHIKYICLKNNVIDKGTIVACGSQALEPHYRGYGDLLANELIVIDIFPKDKNTGYYGDMSRTYLKGTATIDQEKIVDAVRMAQILAISHVKDGVDGKYIHQLVVDYFDKLGYKDAFIHGTGHGIGKEVHEGIKINSKGDILKKGYTITIEPGLYLKDIGCCRIEDVFYITDDGVELLSEHGYKWEIR